MNQRHRGHPSHSRQQRPYIQSSDRFDYTDIYQSNPGRAQPYVAPRTPRPPPPPQPLARPHFAPQPLLPTRQRYAPPPPPPGVGQPFCQERPAHRMSLATPRPLPLRSPGNRAWRPPPLESSDISQGQITETMPPSIKTVPEETIELPKTSSLSDHSEKENSARPILTDFDNSTSVLSPELEKVLKSLMQPLFCKLCSACLNAPNQAQQHYSGKNHAKKVKLFIKETEAHNSEISAAKKVDSMIAPYKNLDRSEPLENQESETMEDMKPLLTDANSKDTSTCSPGSNQKVTADEYCGLCDASFNSPKQAEQHYQGKNHAKKLRLSATANIPLTCDSSIAAGEGSKFTCFVCNVHVTSQGQLTSHLNGSRHKTKLRIQQRGAQSLRGRWSNKQENRGFSSPNGGAGNGGGLPAGIRYEPSRTEYSTGTSDNNNWYQPSPAKKSRRDFSNYRTPSGKYYCSTCNVTLNAEGQFSQHIDSKRHKSSSSVQRNYLESADFT